MRLAHVIPVNMLHRSVCQGYKVFCCAHEQLIERPVTCLATTGHVYAACAVHVTIFSTGGKSDRFQILHSYLLLLKPPALMLTITFKS